MSKKVRDERTSGDTEAALKLELVANGQMHTTGESMV